MLHVQKRLKNIFFLKQMNVHILFMKTSYETPFRVDPEQENINLSLIEEEDTVCIIPL